jgi:hypothetical protein
LRVRTGLVAELDVERVCIGIIFKSHGF